MNTFLIVSIQYKNSEQQLANVILTAGHEFERYTLLD